jgi:hypothetical protein
VTEARPETFTISPDDRFPRAWGAKCGKARYRVDVIVYSNGNTVPPDWLEFTFAPRGDSPLTQFEFRIGASAFLGPMGLGLEAITLEAVSPESYELLSRVVV